MRKNKLNFVFPILAGIYLLLSGCNNTSGGFGGLSGKNTAISSLHQVAVVVENESWAESAVLDTVDFYYASAYPILPRPEPYFDLKLFTYNQLISEKTRRELKVYLVLVDMSDSTNNLRNMMEIDLSSAIDSSSHGVKIVKDKWAFNQLLIYVYAPNKEELASLLIDSYIALRKRISQAYEEQIQANAYVTGYDLSLQNKVRDMMDLDITLPKNYKIAIEDANFLWIRRDRDKIIENIILYREPYQHEDQFSKENIKSILDKLGKKYISSSAEGSYKRINDVDLPLLIHQENIKDLYAHKVRGIWEMENDFMGGPLTAYVLHDEKRSELIVLEGFVFAPGEQKRNTLMVIDYILRSVSL